LRPPGGISSTVPTTYLAMRCPCLRVQAAVTVKGYPERITVILSTSLRPRQADALPFALAPVRAGVGRR
jgi:hypothetical protein